jgi:hypothetical protein
MKMNRKKLWVLEMKAFNIAFKGIIKKKGMSRVLVKNSTW